MKALFVSQSLSLKWQHRLAAALRAPLGLDRVGFYVCESMFFRSFLRQHPEFAAEPHVLKEWEIVAAARRESADLAFLQAKEREYDAGPFWDAFVCDRRIMQGRWCKERQDYRPRFGHDQLLRILSVAVRRIEALFDELRPDVTFSLVPVSFGEYLIWMCARRRGVPTLFLYPTKVLNYMAWMESFFGRPEHLVEAYERYQRAGREDQWTEEARRYLRTVEGQAVRHEGMVPIPGKVKAAARPRRSPLGALIRILKAEAEHWTTESRHDNHVAPPLLSLWQRKVVAPARARAIAARLARHYVDARALASMEFAFYPLHAEPEIALSIQGKPYQNQIETIRNIARSLPVGMTLVTKEHPRCIGYHPYGYYEKLLRIPNVRLADPFIESKTVVQQSRLVATVWSFVGFEGVLNRRPVVTLGTPPFGILPESMIRHVTDPNRLYRAIRDLLDGYRYDETALVRYIAACMNGAVPMDFYARYLEKGGRYTADFGRQDVQAEFDAFVRYTVGRVREACEPRLVSRA